MIPEPNVTLIDISQYAPLQNIQCSDSNNATKENEGPNQSHAKGKLVERWKNVARRLRCVGAIELDSRKSSLLNNSESSTNFSGTYLNLKIIIKLTFHFKLFSLRIGDIKKASEWLKNEGLSASFEKIK